jgi:tRNA(Ile2)-agmatinylcytidine synthase
MHVGLDDTDSTVGGCTTYLAALLVEELEKFQVQFIDYPSLVRLNPNVPWKTRGNGALCLRFKFDIEIEDKLKDATISLWKKLSAYHLKGTDPGIVFLKKQEIPKEITVFSKKTQTSIVTLKKALSLIEKFEGEALGFNTRRGIIGALAAIGETFESDHTYELIAYRTPEKYGSEREVDISSIFVMDKLTEPYTFNNIDYEKSRVIITPRGPDPILLGIRGESPEIVKKAYGLVKRLEQVERWVIFKSNQGTDSHLNRIQALNLIEPYKSVIAKGTVSKNPRTVPLRHIIFSVKDNTAEIDCAAYEPTGDLRKIAKELIKGDTIEVYGAVKNINTSKELMINLEKIHIIELAPKILMQNPLCPDCKKRLKSMGKNQGLRCEKCKRKFNELQKNKFSIPRALKAGMYLTSTRSQRHLTKPLRRYGLEKNQLEKKPLISCWHSTKA